MFAFNIGSNKSETGEDGKEISYIYNGDGLLYERVEGEKRTRYYYDEEAKLIAEADVTGGKPNVTYTYIYDLNDRLWSRMVQATGEMQYYQFNGHGDVIGLTDSQGKQLNTYTYDIWGNPETTEETVPNVFRYSGEYWDSTTKLQYLRARWYDPNAGRFVSKDSYQGSIDNPLSLNRYSYVRNNPLTYIDPSGNMDVITLNLYMQKYIKGRYTKKDLTKKVIMQNKGNIWVAFHEIAQIHIANRLADDGQEVKLEYPIKSKQKNRLGLYKRYEADVVSLDKKTSMGSETYPGEGS